MDDGAVRLLCGIVMPISATDGCSEAHWAEVLAVHCSAIRQAGFEPNLVSNADDSGIIQKRILQNLRENPIVVVDVSGKNANVMLELGMRLAFDKPLIIVKDDKTSYSFDTAPIEHLTYPRDLRFAQIVDFKEKLATKIRATHKTANTSLTYTSFLTHFGEGKSEGSRDNITSVDCILEEIKALRLSLARQIAPPKTLDEPHLNVAGAAFVPKDSIEIGRPRSYRKQHLKLSLLSCPIGLFPALSNSERVSFTRINKNTGNKLARYLDSETGDSVEREDIGRGYEIGRGKYIQIDDEDIEKRRVQRNNIINIDSFVSKVSVDARYLDTPYYIVPTEGFGQEAFAAIRDSLRDKELVALGRIVMSQRERVIMIEPYGKGLLARTLRYPDQVRNVLPFEYIVDVNVSPDVKELVTQLVEKRTTRFDPKKFIDHYENAIVELIRERAASNKTEAVEESESPRVINLMDALRATIKGETRRRPPARNIRNRRRSAAAKKK